MLRRRIFSIAFFLVIAINAIAQIPNGYYTNADGKNGAELKTALYNIIKGHTTISYDALWTAFQTTDKKANGKVWDMYSDKPGQTPPYEFTFITNQCGNYSGEGDCYNREHSFPKSWFNDATPMYSDLFHLYPTDGKVNGQRSNYVFGEVTTTTWTSLNGSKLGTSSASGSLLTVFEPINEYKGDFARTYFYMATRYENLIASWASYATEAQSILAGNSFPAFKDWYVQLLLKWSQQDPVSQKEIERNNAVYAIQNNRNPYIDHPEYAQSIWGSGTIPIVFTSTPSTSIQVGQTFNYSIIVTGAAGATFTITAPTKPVWLTLTNTTNGFATLSGTTTTAGSYNIVLSATDGTATTTQSFALDVVAISGLMYTSTPTLNVTAGSQYSYSVTVTNNSNPTATISLTAPTKPSWLTLTLGGNGIATLSGTPQNVDVGTNQVSLLANDGTTTVQQSFTITVGLSGVTKTETFELMPASASSYSSITWTGDNSTNWQATLARTDQTINDRAICLKADATAYLLSGTISGGCSQIAFKHQQKFTGTGGTIALFINNQQVGSPVSVTTTEQIATFNGFNVIGDFTIKLVSNGLSRIAIDDLSWIGANTPQNILPVVQNISYLPSNPKTNEPVTISATITDSDGTVQEAYVNWGTSTGNLTNRVNMVLNSTVYEAIIPAQTQTGIVYFSVNAKDNSEGISSVTSNYTVSAIPTNAAPTITSITQSPSSPLTGQAVKVTATIADSDGTVQEAYVNWGTSTGNLTNRINMVLNGTVYETTIPAQTQAGIVYFTVNAKDNSEGISSVTSNYTVSAIPTNAAPTITNITQSPSSPLTGQAVKVTATIADSDGTVQEAYVNWGTSTGNLTNRVNMVLNGTVYETTIPAQTQAGIVYFTVNAKDNSEGISSVTSNYTVSAIPTNAASTITNITQSPSSPLTGQAVKVTATITDSDGTVQEAYLNWGTSSGNLVNRVNMVLNSTVYDAIIPAQTQAGIVYFTVNAKDNSEGISSVTSNYTVSAIPTNAAPTITNITQSPSSPLTGQAVKVTATITDSDGTVQEAYLNWGTSSGNLSNRVNMVLNGTVYETTIPAQTQAGIVYFTVNAKDNSEGISSVTSNYTVSAIPTNAAPTITNITQSPSSPLTGQAVKVTATIADSDGTVQEAYLNWGIASGNLSNRIDMVLNAGIYEATIPGQSQAGTIFISINAMDNSGGFASGLSSFTIETNSLPSISNISYVPQNPQVNQTVKISAIIADSDGTIKEAYLNWGAISGSLINRVDMFLNGIIYEAIIPAQSISEIIYFSVNAKDNLDGTSTVLSSYQITPSTETSIDKKQNLLIYPNPTRGILTIEASDGYAERLEISNIIGEKLKSLQFIGEKQTIDLSDLKPGVYFVNVIGINFRKTSRIIIY